MKHLHACPKCTGRKIWIVAPWRLLAHTVEGERAPIVAHQPLPRAGFFDIGLQNPVGKVDLWVCDGCGYSELWAEGVGDLREDPERGVRLLDSSETKAGPFR